MSEWTTGKVGGGLQFARTSITGSYAGTHAGFIEADELLKTVNASIGVLEDGVAYTFSAWVRWAPQAAGSVNFGYATCAFISREAAPCSPSAGTAGPEWPTPCGAANR